ncbi:MAG: hypothetical protein H7321_05620 [Bacteroidia bacterium]|nr:hypothetical protein [Bacteroidia bacterium]
MLPYPLWCMMTHTMALRTEFSDPPDLIARCISGERSAQKEMYDLYKRAMYTVALRITNNEALACDALQEAFLEVFRDLKKFKSESTAGVWIKTIVIRKAVKKTKFECRYEAFEVCVVS